MIELTANTNATSEDCEAPTRLGEAGSARLGPLQLSGFEDGAGARLMSRRGEARLIVQHDTRDPKPTVLRAVDCQTGEAMTLIAIGSPRPISLPTSFPESAGSDYVTMSAEHPHFALIFFPRHRGSWRLTATNDGEEVGSIVIEIAAAT